MLNVSEFFYLRGSSDLLRDPQSSEHEDRTTVVTEGEIGEE
jgi:hypothetical protein